MDSSSLTLPLVGVSLFMAVLLLLDFAFGAAPAVYLGFLPAIIWACVLGARGRT